jgi:DNA invertase Pin-like site-specific DNA recombinase
VHEHQESTRRQYELRQRACQLGWTEQAIMVIDEDLGHSASERQTGRPGFEKMVSDVALGQVGAIFSVEVSRLSRQDSEWHHLIEIAALSGTLLIGEQQIYDPRNSDDRLMLGIKGLLSSSEVRQMSMRLWENQLRKAQRGELRINLPIGFIFDPEQQAVMLDPNEQIQASVKLLFERYRLDGAISGVVRYFQENNLRFPKHEKGWGHSVTWGPLSCQRVSAILHNPIYAGAYVFGRKTTRAALKPAEKRNQKTVDLPPESWAVTLWDAFEGYISEADYREHQAKLLKRHGRHQNHRRDGAALLTGLALCGICGRRLQVRYSGGDGTHVTYLCNHRQRRYAEPVCQEIPGKAIDIVVAETVLAALTSAQIELAMAVEQELQQQQDSLRQQWQHRIQAAHYAARQAERRFENVDPENRLVAATLERRWNSALQDLAELEAESTRQMEQTSLRLEPTEQARLMELVHDLPQLWHADSTSWTQRKSLLPLLIADVILTRNETNVLCVIRWHTDELTELSVPIPVRGAPALKPEILNLIRTLAQTHSDYEIACELNRRNHLTAQGKPFDARRVAGARRRFHITKS